ncbi:MAG: hypothetical protein GC145_06085 [Caulobacter sp.]|nr:hypothetical protein [Caulobacter sp.]
MNALTPLALQNAELLDVLAGGIDFATTTTDLARTLGRDRSNLAKSLKALREALLVAEDGLSLTAAGEEARAAIHRANGPEAAPEAAPEAPPGDIPPGTVLLTHDVIAFDGENARTHSGLSPLEIEDMAASIRDRHAAGRPGLITPPTVRRNPPLRPDTRWPWILVHGERRLRGWRLAIERGWLPADTAFPCPVFTGDDVEATEEALVENLQRVDLDNLEAAEGLRNLSDKTDPPATAAAIAKRLGKEERWVEERLKVAREAEPAAKQRYRAWVERSADPDYDPKADDDVFRWTNLRNSVKKPRHLTALEKNPRLAMLIAELAQASEEATGVWDAAVTVKVDVPGGVSHEAEKLGLLSIFVSGSGPELRHHLRLLPPATDWLAASGFGDGAEDLLELTRRAALGEFGYAALPPGQWGSDLLNLPPDPIVAPTPEPPAPGPTERPGLVGDAFSRQLAQALAEEGGLGAPDGDPSPAPAPNPIAPAPANPPPPAGSEAAPVPPTAGHGPGVDPQEQVDAGAAPSPLADLPPAARLALLETALAVRLSGQETRGGGQRGVPVFDFHQDTVAWPALFQAKLAIIGQAVGGGGFLAILTQRALDALAAEYPEGVDRDDVMAQAGKMALEGFSVAPAGRFNTPWLNPPAKPAPEPRSAPAAQTDTPSRAPSDPVIDAFRAAAADLWHATREARRILDNLIEGHGAGDDELAEASRSLQDSAMTLAPFLTADQKADR